jgi:CBS domain containing-hemolysin-like protein
MLLCILVSCVFSGSETGFISWNPLKVSHAASQGNFSARVALYLMKHRERILTTVLIGNNVCNIGAAFIFIKLFSELDALVPLDLARIPSPESLFLTPVMVLFSEILPKSMYRTYPYLLTMKSVPFLTFFYLLFTPFFLVLGQISRLFLKGADRAGESYNAKVRQEIVLVAVEGAKRGNIFEAADEMLENTLAMKGRRIGALSVTLDEWKNSRPVYNVSQPLSELGRESLGQADEIVVFDDNLAFPAGYISLLDAAPYFSDRENLLSVRLSTLLKPLPRLKSSMEVLSCLRRLPQDSPRYSAVYSKDTVAAILDKMTLFEAAFIKNNSHLS